jgi:hypothetical protein
MKNQETPIAEPSNAFPQLLSELDHGFAQDECSRQLTDLVRAVQEVSKPGELVVKLKITPAGAGKLMTITYDVTSKKPKEDKDATLLFATENGQLQRENPEQKTFNLRSVPTDPAQVAKDLPATEPVVLKAVGK